jgi:glucokinase
MYVIGGGVASAWEAFAPTMMERVRKNSFVYRATATATNMPGGNAQSGAARASIITPALLGSDAGLIGAARLPMMSNQTMSNQTISSQTMSNQKISS